MTRGPAGADRRPGPRGVLALALGLALGACTVTGCAVGAGAAPDPAPDEAGQASAVDEAAADRAGAAPGPRAAAARDDASALGVGGVVVDLALVDVEGRTHSVTSLLGDRDALVVLFTTLECPAARRWAPDFPDLARRLGPRVGVVVVDPALGDAAPDLAARAARDGWPGPVFLDPPGFTWTEALRAERTTEAFVLDRARRLRYRGALDDRVGVGYVRAAPRARWLEDAVAAVLAGQDPPVEATSAPGCAISRPPRPAGG